jgi:hypothetical protein
MWLVTSGALLAAACIPVPSLFGLWLRCRQPSAAAVRAVPLACLPAYLRHQPSAAIAQYPASRFPPRLPCSYVTPGAFFESARAAGLSEADIAAGDQRRILQARWYLYQPGGAMARELAKNPTVLVVNDVVFAHGGLLPHHLKYGLQRINDEVGDWMNGATRPDGTQAAPPFPAMGDANSVQWNRTFGKERVSDCEWGLRVLRCRARQRTGLAVCGRCFLFARRHLAVSMAAWLAAGSRQPV